MKDFSTGFRYPARYPVFIRGHWQSRSRADRRSLSRRVASRCDLFASKSALALHTDVRGVRADSRYATHRETSLRARYALPLRSTYVANQDVDTLINHSRQRPGVQHCSDKIYAARCGDTVRRNTVLGQYRVDTVDREPSKRCSWTMGLFGRSVSRERHITGHSLSAPSISAGLICYLRIINKTVGATL